MKASMPPRLTTRKEVTPADRGRHQQRAEPDNETIGVIDTA